MKKSELIYHVLIYMYVLYYFLDKYEILHCQIATHNEDLLFYDDDLRNR